MLGKSAGVVLASLRGSTYQSLRLAALPATALPIGPLSILRLFWLQLRKGNPSIFSASTGLFHSLLYLATPNPIDNEQRAEGQENEDSGVLYGLIVALWGSLYGGRSSRVDEQRALLE